MKAKLLFMTLSVAALVSCSNDETLDTNRSAISFRSLVEGMTRGTSVTVANLDQFKVTAVGNGKVYMDKVAVNGSESGAKWATEGTYYWPAFQLDFYGYAPADAQGVTLNETTRTIADFTPAQKVEEQKDLVIACNTGTKESNQETGVPMNFRHALSQVVVKAKCPAENMKVEVIGIKVANVAGKGTFTFPADVTTGKNTRQLDFSLWSGLGDATAAYMKRGDAPVTLTRDAQDITFADRFILVPQQLTAWAGNNEDKGAYLSVLCRISNVSGDNVTQLYPSEEGKYGFSAVAIDTKWEPGKRYVYTLEFFGQNGGGGKYDPDPTNPDPDPDKDKDIDKDPEPDKEGGDPILDKPIFFTVTVDDWVEQPAIDLQM